MWYDIFMAAITKKTQHELELLRSLAISIVGRDKEGTYKPAFVRRVLKASMRKPTYTFTTPEKFLKEVKRAA